MAALRGGRLLVALLTGLWSFAADAALQAHVAAYRLSLAGAADMANPFSEVRGGLVIEWRLACDGWLSRQRLAFVGTLQEGGDLSHDVRFSSWEALDGARMRYSYRSYGNDELQEEFRGEAVLAPSEGGVATFTTPSEIHRYSSVLNATSGRTPTMTSPRRADRYTHSWSNAFSKTRRNDQRW